MRWSGIVFDRDGTLFESLPLILRSFNHAIEPYTDKRPSTEEWFAAFGPAEQDVLAKFIGEQNKQQAFQRFFEYYTQHISEVRLFPGMFDLLVRLKKAGVKLIVFTGGGRASTRFCLEKGGILQHFDELITGDDVRFPKPHPEGILKAMELCNLTPSETLAVGDARADVQAGKSAHISTALARWGAFSQAPQAGAEADYTFDSVAQFETFLFEDL